MHNNEKTYYHQFIVSYNGAPLWYIEIIVIRNTNKEISYETFKKALKEEQAESSKIYKTFFIKSHIILIDDKID
jgi:hypothetical protein